MKYAIWNRDRVGGNDTITKTIVESVDLVDAAQRFLVENPAREIVSIRELSRSRIEISDSQIETILFEDERELDRDFWEGLDIARVIDCEGIDVLAVAERLRTTVANDMVYDLIEEEKPEFLISVVDDVRGMSSCRVVSMCDLVPQGNTVHGVDLAVVIAQSILEQVNILREDG